MSRKLTVSSVSFAKSPAKELWPLGCTVPGGVDWMSGMIEDQQADTGDYTLHFTEHLQGSGDYTYQEEKPSMKRNTEVSMGFIMGNCK